jgi:guanylate kinase
MDIEVAGARQIRERFPDSVHVFVLPPSGAELVERLQRRNTEAMTAVDRRLEIASEELHAALEYEYVVVNDDMVEAVSQVAAILDVETRRVHRLTNLDRVIDDLRRDLAGQQQRLRG